MPSIKGHHALLIGGSSGIGFAAANLALENGVRVVIVSSNPSRVSSAVKTLQSSFPGGKVSGHAFDLEQPDLEANLEKLFKTVTSDGKDLLDHIVYTAARAPPSKPLAETTYEDITSITRTLFVPQLLVAKLSATYLKPGATSSLTFTGGHVSHKPAPGYSIMTAAAAGLIGLTLNLAIDLAPRRVNLVSPGSTMTEMWGPNEQREQLRAYMAPKSLLGKVGTPEEVGEAYVYLMRDSNATGTTVNSEGGSFLKFA